MGVNWKPTPAEELMLKTLAAEWVIDHDMPRAFRAAASRCEVDVDRIVKLQRHWGFTFGVMCAVAQKALEEAKDG